MNAKHFACVAVIGLCVSFTAPSFAAEKAYTEGTVWTVTMVKVKTGMADDYLSSLQANYKKLMEEAKKDQLVLSYKVLASEAANRDDWDLLLLVEYKNMAAFDGIEEKFDAMSQKVIGSDEDQKKIQMTRVEMREIMGSKLCRELVFK